MSRSFKRIGYLFVLLGLLGSAAWAGGEMGEGDKKADEGPHFFGFVRDDAGQPVADAKVTAAIKGGITYIMRTPKNGLYRFGGLSKAVRPGDVTISCAKEGYTQVRTFRRPVPKGKDAKAVETDCRLQKG